MNYFCASDFFIFLQYHNDPKFLDRQVWANSVDPDQTEQSDQGLHCLPLCLHLLDTLFYMVKPSCSNLRVITSIFGCPNI